MDEAIVNSIKSNMAEQQPRQTAQYDQEHIVPAYDPSDPEWMGWQAEQAFNREEEAAQTAQSQEVKRSYYVLDGSHDRHESATGALYFLASDRHGDHPDDCGDRDENKVYGTLRDQDGKILAELRGHEVYVLDQALKDEVGQAFMAEHKIHDRIAPGAAFDDVMDRFERNMKARGMFVPVDLANTLNGQYSGTVIAANEKFVIQNVGRDQAILHKREDLGPEYVAEDKMLNVRYRPGKSVEHIQEHGQQLAR